MEAILLFYFLLMENCSTLLHFTDIFVSIEMQQMIIYETFCNNKKTFLFFKFAHKVGNNNGRMLFYYWYLGILLSIWSKCLLVIHCVKSIRIWSYSGPHFPEFRLKMESYGVSLRIQSECGKMWTRITPNTGTFDAVSSSVFPFLR